MTIRFRVAIGLLCLVALGACSQPARVSQMTVTNIAGASVAADPALLGVLAVAEVSGGQETNPLWTSEVGNAEFRAALENSLQANALLAGDAAAAPYRVSAELQEVDQPVFGFDFTVTSIVAYRVVDAAGAIFFERTVTHPFTASVGDSFYAAKRLQVANEGSIAGNIRIFINDFIAHWQASRAAS